MLEILLSLLQAAIGFYWAGEVARQNPKIDATLGAMEDGFSQFLLRVKEGEETERLNALASIYKNFVRIVIFLVVMLGLLVYLDQWLGLDLFETIYKFIPFSSIAIILVIASVFAILSYSSIEKWVPQKKKVSDPFLMLFLVCFAVGMLIVGVVLLDGGDLSNSKEKAIFGGGLVLGIVLTFAFLRYLSYYFVYVSVVFLEAGSKVATKFHEAFPRKPFFGFTVILMLSSILTQAWIGG